MTLSMYQACTPVLVRGLENLSAILEKAKATVAAGRVTEAELIEARLAPDMFALPRQIHVASDTAKACVARLAGVEAPSFADTEITLDELQARIAKTVAYLNSIAAEQIDGSEERAIVLKFPNMELNFTGQSYLLGFVLPNFYFHVTTAYGILRSKGVPLTKQDYIGAP